MTAYRLTYFDIDGGRAEPVRIAFHAGNIPFEDNRISYPEFMEIRQSLRFTCVPVLEIDGEPVTQSTAMCRYVGGLAGLYPQDPIQALFCDEVLGAVEDVTNHVGRTMRLEGDEQRQAREALAEGWLPIYFKGMAELLARGGGEYFAGGQLTVADLNVFILTGWLKSGMLDHIPTDLVDNLAPSIIEHRTRVAADPRVTAYYASRA